MKNGKWVRVGEGEVFRCRCGVVKDGAKRGPKGGRQWTVLVAGQQVCGEDCPSLSEVRAEEAMDDAQGEYEASMGEALYGEA